MEAYFSTRYLHRKIKRRTQVGNNALAQLQITLLNTAQFLPKNARYLQESQWG